MKKLRPILLIFAFALPAFVFSQNIRVQLKWWHQFQFAGYYAAQVKGYYKDAGMNVTLLPGNKINSSLEQVINKQADYGVAGSEIMIDFINGAPIQAMAAIFQHSPYVIISPQKNHILKPHDLVGKRVMLSDNQGWIQLKAVLMMEGIDPSSIQFIPHTWNNNDLLDDNVDAMSAYSSVEAYQLEKTGLKINIIRPENYGVDFYGDILFSTKSNLQNNREVSNKFLDATRRGWEYAMNNPKEISEYILTLPGVKERGVTLAELNDEAYKMQALVVPKLVEIGHMNNERWQHMLAVYKSLKLVDKDKQLVDWQFDSEDAQTKMYLKVGSYILITSLGVLLILFIYSVNMKKAVENRTRELENEVRLRKANEESLNALSTELQNTNKELRQYAYITSHNLRAPVTNLLSLIQLFNSKELSEKNALYFNKIDVCTTNLNIMLKDLNEVLSVRNEKFGDENLLYFEEEILNVKESISEEIFNTGSLITFDFSRAPSILYSRKNLQSIMQNLLTNAIKYRKTDAPAHIDIISWKVNGDIKLAFSDNGIGINMQRHGDRIFGLYQRFNKEKEGKGLGLYIVKSQVEKYGGGIEVESVENEGTKFIITFKTPGKDEEESH